MKLSDFDYKLPENLIATHQISPRDHSRLLVLDKITGEIEHKHFYDIVDYLNKGDVLVVNNSKVIPARLFAKKETGGKVEVLLHKKRQSPHRETLTGHEIWECMLGGRVKEGLKLFFLPLGKGELEGVNGQRTTPSPSLLKEGKNLVAEILKNNEDGTWNLRFNKKGKDLMEAFGKLGEVPLPPYIIKQREKGSLHSANAPVGMTKGVDRKNYQTIYASDDKKGSVAAPTAGLHFTSGLLEKIRIKGVKVLEITLYVGMGTFAPVKVEDFKKHKMHAEWVEIDNSVINELRITNYELRNRIIAVGTTSCRALEACFSKLKTTPNPSHSANAQGRLLKRRGGFKDWVDIFIYPPYKFKVVDAMITNFHLPKSTLLMLVSALASKKNIDKAYKEAVKKKYRFYSYGDAMFIK